MRSIKLEMAENHCKGCELCVRACPKGVLAMGSHVNALGYRPATIVAPEECTGCRACALVCPEVCFTVWQTA